MSLGKARLLRSIVFSSLAIAYPTLAPAKENSADLAMLEKQCVESLTGPQCYSQIGHCMLAASYAEREPNHEKSAKSISEIYRRISQCELGRSRHRLAIDAIRKSIHVLRKGLGKDSAEVAEDLNNLAAMLKDISEFKESEHAYRSALSSLEKKLGKNHRDIAILNVNLSSTLTAQGRFSEALTLLKRSISVLNLERSQNEKHIASALNNLAVNLTNTGEFEQAMQALKEGLDIQEKAEHKDRDIEIMKNLNNQASIHLAVGSYQKGEELCVRALKMLERQPEKNLFAQIVIQNTLASLLYRQWRWREAAEYYERNRRILESLDKMHDDIYAFTLHNVALTREATGEQKEAEEYYLRSISILEKNHGQEHPEVAKILHDLSDLYRKKNMLAKAKSLSMRSYSILIKTLSPTHPQIAISLNNLARINHLLNNLVESAEQYVQAMEILKKKPDSNQVILASIISNLAQLRLEQGDEEACFSLLEQAARFQELSIRTSQGEIRVNSLSEFLRDGEGMIYSEAINRQRRADWKALAISIGILHKGRGLDAATQTYRLARNVKYSTEASGLLNKIKALKNELIELINGNQRKDSQIRKTQMQLIGVEAQLAQALPELQNLQPPPFEEIIPAVAKQIPKDGVLVEVVTARPFQAKTDEPDKRWGPPRFVALLLFPDQKIVSVDLGLVEDMDQAGRALLAGLRSPKSNPVAAAQAMYQRVFAPLTPHLIGKKEVFLSPDGSLHMIPFDALHDGKDYLLGRYRFHYLTSGRDLLRQPSQRTPGQPLIIGDPDVGPSDAASRPQNQTIYNISSDLTPLRGARKEAVFIGKQSGVTPLLGVDAREEIIHQAKGPLFLHIPTHGFFPTGGVLPVPDDVRSSLLPLLPMPDPKGQGHTAPDRLPSELDAMNLGVLLLAGARSGHLAKSTDEDGLLSAQEVRLLDLDGTQLVTLPACDSGQGFTSIGQGVYGLRRAFLIAGAETVVSSLWRIDDDATGDLMQRYYAKLLDPLKPGDRLGSMIESMQELRAEPKWSHPYYWAPFLVIGRDGPLRRP